MAKSGPYRIEVKSHADGSVQVVTCTKSSMTVGSDAFNDLILNGPLIQPHHLRIDSYGRQVRIVYGSSDRNAQLRADARDEGVSSATTWKPGESEEVGNYTLTLLSPKVMTRPIESRTQGFGEDVFGSTVSKHLRFAAPLRRLFSMRWLVVILLGGAFVYGIGRVDVSSLLPKPISLLYIAPRMEPNWNTAIPISRGKELSTPVPTVTVTWTPTPTPPLPYWTPTRLPVQPLTDIPSEAVLDGPDSTLIGSLVDGPKTVPSDAVMVLVTATPTLMPTATVAPVETIELSPVLKQLGIWIEPAIVPVGETYWRLEEARWLNEDESLGRNMIFVEIVDAAGHRMNREWVHFMWADGGTTLMPNKSATDAYALDFLMNASGNAYSVQLKSMPSDTIHGLGMGTVEKRMAFSKTAFWLKFQQTTRQ